MKAIICLAESYKKEDLEGKSLKNIVKMIFDDRNNGVKVYDVDIFQERYNSGEVPEGYLYFVDFDDCKPIVYAEGTMLYDSTTGNYTMIKSYDAECEEYTLSDGCRMKWYHVLGRIVDDCKADNMHDETHLPTWARQGQHLHFGHNVTGHPFIKGVQSGIVWIERTGATGNREYYGKSIDAFIAHVRRGWVGKI